MLRQLWNTRNDGSCYLGTKLTLESINKTYLADIPKTLPRARTICCVPGVYVVSHNLLRVSIVYKMMFPLGVIVCFVFFMNVLSVGFEIFLYTPLLQNKVQHCASTCKKHKFFPLHCSYMSFEWKNLIVFSSLEIFIIPERNIVSPPIWHLHWLRGISRAE